MRTLDTLIQQVLMMQEIDHAANGDIAVKGWYNDLSLDEKELFDNWLIDITKLIEQTFGGIGEILAKHGQSIVEGSTKGLTPSP